MHYTYYVLHPATKNQKTYYRGKLKLLLRIIIIARTASNFAFPIIARSNRKPNRKKKGKIKFIESIFVITCTLLRTRASAKIFLHQNYGAAERNKENSETRKICGRVRRPTRVIM